MKNTLPPIPSIYSKLPSLFPMKSQPPLKISPKEKEKELGLSLEKRETEKLEKIKSFLTGNKDTDFIVLSKLNDEDLLSFCNTDKYANELCKDEMFWKRRFLEKFGNIEKDEGRTWRDLYLKIVYYTDKYKNPYEILSILHEKKLTLKSDLVNYFISLIKPKIYNAMISELESQLTVGREDEDLEPFTSKEVKTFIKRNSKKIEKAVKNMIKTYYKDGDITELENPENDWYREFLLDFREDETKSPNPKVLRSP